MHGFIIKPVPGHQWCNQIHPMRKGEPIRQMGTAAFTSHMDEGKHGNKADLQVQVKERSCRTWNARLTHKQ